MFINIKFWMHIVAFFFFHQELGIQGVTVVPTCALPFYARPSTPTGGNHAADGILETPLVQKWPQVKPPNIVVKGHLEQTHPRLSNTQTHYNKIPTITATKLHNYQPHNDISTTKNPTNIKTRHHTT